jgi:hypothetical protein
MLHTHVAVPRLAACTFVFPVFDVQAAYTYTPRARGVRLAAGQPQPQPQPRCLPLSLSLTSPSPRARAQLPSVVCVLDTPIQVPAAASLPAPPPLPAALAQELCVAVGERRARLDWRRCRETPPRAAPLPAWLQPAASKPLAVDALPLAVRRLAQPAHTGADLLSSRPAVNFHVEPAPELSNAGAGDADASAADGRGLPGALASPRSERRAFVSASRSRRQKHMEHLLHGLMRPALPGLDARGDAGPPAATRAFGQPSRDCSHLLALELRSASRAAVDIAIARALRLVRVPSPPPHPL